MSDVALGPAFPVAARGEDRIERGESLAAWLLTAPATAAFVLMLLIPTLAAVGIAFTDYEFGTPTLRYVGLANFAELR